MECSLTSPAFLQYYINIMFPYNILNRMQTALNSSTVPSLVQFFATVTNPASAPNDFGYMFGHYFYFMALSAVLLAVKLDKRLLFPGTWIVSSLLYLGFGTMSLSRYIKVSPVYSRYLLIIVPAAVLMIAFGLTKILELWGGGRRKKGEAGYRRYVAYAVVAIILLFLFPNLCS